MVMGKVRGPGAICGQYISTKRANYITYSTIPQIKEAVKRLEECSDKQIIINLTRVIEAYANAAHYNIVKGHKSGYVPEWLDIHTKAVEKSLKAKSKPLTLKEALKIITPEGRCRGIWGDTDEAY